MTLGCRLPKNFDIVLVLAIIVAFSAICMFYSMSYSLTIGVDRRWGVHCESVNWDNNTGQIKAVVRNEDNLDVTISQIYVNGTLDDNYVIVPQVIQHYQTAELTLSETYSKMPNEVKIEFVTDDGHKSGSGWTFIDFEMLGLYWDEEWGKIKVVVDCYGDYPELAFGEIYVNGTLDEEVVITKQFYTDDPLARYYPRYDIYLSGTYENKPTYTELRIIPVNGHPFDFAVPFPQSENHHPPIIHSFWYDESIGQIKVLVRFHGANIPEGAFTYADIYVNGTLDDAAIIYPKEEPFYEVVLSRVYEEVPSQITIKLLTHYGEFNEIATDELEIRP